MSDLLVKPGLLCGTVLPPPAKSDAHRALIAAAMAGEPAAVHGLQEPLSEDLEATRRCLAALTSGRQVLDCHESGTTLRLLVPLAAAFDRARRADPLVFTGSGRLPQRPLDEYKAILGPAGLAMAFPAHGSLPLQISGSIRPGDFTVPGHISSQYVSGLLMALPLLSGPSRILLSSPLQSAPYVDMTIRTLAAFGIDITCRDQSFNIEAPQIYRPADYTVERDYSQAAFWLTAAYGGCQISVSGLPDRTAQGDRAIAGLLADFARHHDHYVIDASQIPDLVPILAVAAVLTPAVTRIVNAGRLRLKESDRLETTCRELGAAGADIRIERDSLVIRGCGLPGSPVQLVGGVVDSHGDHRIAMAMAIAALFSEKGIVIKHAEAVRKSYPDFFHHMKRLGGDIHELDLGTEPAHQLIW